MSDKEKIELSQGDDENVIDFLWRCIKTLTEVFNRTSVQYGTMARRLEALENNIAHYDEVLRLHDDLLFSREEQNDEAD